MFIHKIDENTTLAMVEMHDADELFALVDTSRMYLREWLPWVDSIVSVEETKEFVHDERARIRKAIEGDTSSTIAEIQGIKRRLRYIDIPGYRAHSLAALAHQPNRLRSELPS